MKFLKSYFWYNKSQRNGIFLLAVIAVVLQILIYFDFFSSKEIIEINSSQVLTYQQQIDSLKKVEIQNRKPKLFPFNPNYITDFKGEHLGMSLEEIDKLIAFRKTGKFINSTKEFQQVTKVSDSLLSTISPYFKFPEWVEKRKQQQTANALYSSKSKYFNYSTKKISTTDINKATAEDFQTISGIGPAFSERIIKYRAKLQGFSLPEQLNEVWGLEKEVVNRVLLTFKIIEKPVIIKQNVNTVSFKELLKNPYIDYDLCKKIFSYRDEVAELQDITELKNIEDFPLEKYARIVLYLQAK